MSKLDEVLATEGDAAERTPTPEDAKGEHRNLSRSMMFSVRLQPEELAELQRYADHRGLPARTLARAWILDRLREEDHGGLSRRVERLEQAVFPQTA
jgi:hypothetical protein